jgi:hypothetical protein
VDLKLPETLPLPSGDPSTQPAALDHSLHAALRIATIQCVVRD